MEHIYPVLRSKFQIYRSREMLEKITSLNLGIIFTIMGSQGGREPIQYYASCSLEMKMEFI